MSVVIPMLDERSYIEACLDGFAEQTWPHELLDVIVVDGGSADGSREQVERRALSQPWVRVIDNRKRSAAAAFNRGVEEAKGEVVCLFSAHGVPDRNYVEASVDVLADTGAVGVGGRYLHIGLDRPSSAIGLAMVSPFGMASAHRFATTRKEVDTVSHPAYRIEALKEVGRFNESLARNSDYELNYRLRATGGRLVFDPSISSIYRPRPSLKALGRQFWWYGRWKERVIRRHPGSLRRRHLVAPAAVAGACLSPIVALDRRGRRLVLTATMAYAAATAIAVAASRPRQNHANPAVLAAAFPVMHGAWGAGFLASLIEDIRQV